MKNVKTYKWWAGRLFIGLIEICISVIFILSGAASAQTLVVDKKKFFTDDQLVEMTIVSDFKKLIGDKLANDFASRYQPATITCLFPEGTIGGQVEIRPRGEYRRKECYMPSVMVNFDTDGITSLNKLGRLKLVWPCSEANYDEQLILKEYLVYKIYNLLTEKSFRVRLVRMTYRDINEKIRSRRFYAFFIEDVDDLARRNSCVEVEPYRPSTESTDRGHTTLVALFQYMIGNTDWAIPVYQNIKLIRPKKDSTLAPFVVPYDFDYCGLVNAEYAVPAPELDLRSVTQRRYMGFPRTMEELTAVIGVFERKKAAIDSLIVNLDVLNTKHKNEMLRFIQDFYAIIKKEKNIRYVFITNARKM